MFRLQWPSQFRYTPPAGSDFYKNCDVRNSNRRNLLFYAITFSLECTFWSAFVILFSRLFEGTRKSTGFAILCINIVNFAAKHLLVVNHVDWVKDTDIHTPRADRDVQPGLEIILCSFAENDKIFLILISACPFCYYMTETSICVCCFYEKITSWETCSRFESNES